MTVLGSIPWFTAPEDASLLREFELIGEWWNLEVGSRGALLVSSSVSLSMGPGYLCPVCLLIKTESDKLSRLKNGAFTHSWAFEAKMLHVNNYRHIWSTLVVCMELHNMNFSSPLACGMFLLVAAKSVNNNKTWHTQPACHQRALKTEDWSS